MDTEGTNKELTEKDYLLIRNLADRADLTPIGGDAAYICDSNIKIDVNVALMTKAQYKELSKSVKEFYKKFKGFDVYATQDLSSYEYWVKEGQQDETNYIQVCALIRNPHEVNPDELKEQIEEATISFEKWDNVSSPTRDNISARIYSLREHMEHCDGCCQRCLSAMQWELAPY
jgi:hypothetical protein